MKAILAFLLVLLLPVPLAARHESEWTVVTLARDGSWGVEYVRVLRSGVGLGVAQMRGHVGGQSDCGAEVTAVRQGWTLGTLCGDHRVLVAATDLTTAIMDAQARQSFLRDLYGDSLPNCSCVMWVDPRGFAASSRKPGISARTALGK